MLLHTATPLPIRTAPNHNEKRRLTRPPSPGSLQRASPPLRRRGRRNGAAGALPRPDVRADARLLVAPARVEALLPAPGVGAGPLGGALLPTSVLLPHAAGTRALRAAEDTNG